MASVGVRRDMMHYCNSIEKSLDIAGYAWPLTAFIAGPAHQILGVLQTISGIAIAMFCHVQQQFMSRSPNAQASDALENRAKELTYLESYKETGYKLTMHGMANIIRGVIEEKTGLVGALGGLTYDYWVDMRLGHKVFYYDIQVSANQIERSRPVFNQDTLKKAADWIGPRIDTYLTRLGISNPLAIPPVVPTENVQEDESSGTDL